MLAARALVSSVRARGRLDQSFATYGRRLALSMLARREPGSAELFVTPVSSMRYWEFPFAWRAIPVEAVRCLDVGSPRLLSLRAADDRGIAVLMLNPDTRDAAETDRLARLRDLPVTVVTQRVDQLLEDGFDCAWSISVIEHIAGDEGDSDAMRRMFAALRPGGRLIITVPVDRVFRLDFRDEDPYGLATGSGPFFFQRLYDEAAIDRRLIGAVGVQPSVVGWFGEREAGSWNAYEAEWIARGVSVTATDAERMALGYRTFETWAEMPGVGVCGLVFEKPAPS